MVPVSNTITQGCVTNHTVSSHTSVIPQGATQPLHTPSSSVPSGPIHKTQEPLTQSQWQPQTPIKYGRLAHYLRGYNTQISHRLVTGFKYGFRIHHYASVSHDLDKNLKTATKLPDIVDKKIQKELSSGRILGPFRTPPFTDFVISPLGLREKKVKGEFRVIHDLFFPIGDSVNSGIPREYAQVKYSSVYDAIQHILDLGPNCYLAKTDILSAFRIIPIHRDDIHLLGFKWNDLYYFDKCLPMGCSSSCQIFESFSTSLEWIVLQHLYGVKVIHLLDDFLFIAPNYSMCLKALQIFQMICQDIGVPLSPEKTVGPSQILPFAGIQLNTVEMFASLPDDKVTKFIGLIDLLLQSKTVRKRVVESLCGMLNFACCIVLPGRAFSRRLYDIVIGIPQPYYHVKMTKSVKQDLWVWKIFLSNYNYKTFFLDQYWISSDQLQLYTDSSGSIGYGAVYQNHWLVGTWEPSCIGLNIAILELYPIVLAIHVWGKFFSNKCIHIHSDNMAVVGVLNSSTSKEPTIMSLIRRLVLYTMSHNIYIKASHIPGASNTVCDLISRQKLGQARKVAPQLDEEPTPTPPQFTLRKWLLALHDC